MPVKLDDVTDEELDSLGASSGGLDLSNIARREFLREMGNRDVQAAPGAGKTTLLGLKLRLVGRRWQPGMGAVAVVSHTNVARQEIEKQLSGRADADVILRYPHFIGTLTQFVHQFMALPTVRGLGFEIHSIDRDMYEAAARAALMSATGARMWLANQSRLPPKVEFGQRLYAGATNVAHRLTIDPRNPSQISAPEGLVDRTNATFVALQEVKDTLNARGIFCFEDMLALAQYSLEVVPSLVEGISRRFPLIILDEAQDTSAEALAIVRMVRDGGSVFQCIGDVNQAILASGAKPAWQPASSAIDLNETKRFGPSIAAVASKLGVHKPQEISSTKSPDSSLHLLIYDKGAETKVGDTFAALVANELGSDGNYWAVAHRKNPSETAKKAQSVLGSYFPSSNFSDASEKPPGLHECVLRYAGGMSGVDVVEHALCRAVERCKLDEDTQKLVRTRRLLRGLDRREPEVAQSLRRWVASIVEHPPKLDEDWSRSLSQLTLALESIALLSDIPSGSDELRYYDGDLSTPASADAPQHQETFSINGSTLKLNLGTIASIKGQTHDATLILQTSYFNMKPFAKLTEALKAKAAVRWGPQESSLLSNFYVAATRPRRLLAYAAPIDQVSNKDRNLLTLAGWNIIEVHA